MEVEKNLSCNVSTINLDQTIVYEDESISNLLKGFKSDKVFYFIVMFLVMVSITFYPEFLNVDHKAYNISSFEGQLNPFQINNIDLHEQRKKKTLVDFCEESCDDDKSNSNKSKNKEMRNKVSNCLYLCKRRMLYEYFIVFGGMFSLLAITIIYIVVSRNSSINNNVKYLFNRIIHLLKLDKNINSSHVVVYTDIQLKEKENIFTASDYGDQSTINETKDLFNLLDGVDELPDDEGINKTIKGYSLLE